MNSPEALRRIAKVIRWIGISAAVPVFLITGLAIHYEVGDKLAIGLAGLAVAAFFFLAAKAAAWILEGLVKDK